MEKLFPMASGLRSTLCGFFILSFLFLSDEGPMLEMLDYTIHIGSTPTFLYFNLYLFSAYAAHYVYIKCGCTSHI